MIAVCLRRGSSDNTYVSLISALSVHGDESFTANLWSLRLVVCTFVRVRVFVCMCVFTLMIAGDCCVPAVGGVPLLPLRCQVEISPLSSLSIQQQ